MGLILLYRGGGLLLLGSILPIHLLLFVLEQRAGKTWPQVMMLGVTHLVFATGSCQGYGWLYLNRVCYDELGKAILWGITFVTAGLVILLWSINIATFVRGQRSGKTE